MMIFKRNGAIFNLSKLDFILYTSMYEEDVYTCECFHYNLQIFNLSLFI